MEEQSTARYSWETVPLHVGREMGVTDWVTVDQEAIDRFAACTGDRQWIHVDIERAAREAPGGSTIAHGFLLLSLIGRFSFEVPVFPPEARQILNYGLDKVRFLAPVRAGARVRDRVTIAAAEEKSPGRMLLRTLHTLEIEGESKPAMVAESLTLLIAG